MTEFLQPQLWQPALIALVAAAALTPLVRAGARRMGMVAAPKKDRWHERPTALMGGMAIFLAVVSVAIGQLHHVPSFTRAILPACAFVFLIGLIDDIFNLKPYQKLVGQIIASAVIVWSGLVLPWTTSSVFNSAVTMFWLIGITNAMNMLDNMDGLAAGVAAIAAMFLALNFTSLGQTGEAKVILVLAGALLGFLIYNSQPASIFMGDCGSMFIGFFLASMALLTTTSGRTRSFLPVIAVPVLTLLIPIFDTTFVTLLRKLSGRAASQGGRDHTSHRLVALGLSERRAVWLLYSLATVAGFLAIQVRHWRLHESVMAILGFTIVLTLIGVYLGGVKVYSSEPAPSSRTVVSFLVDLSYKRRIFEILLDVSLIVIAWYGAWGLRFGRMDPTDPQFRMMVRTLPVVVALKIAVFLASGIYRGLWRYVSVHDLMGIARATIIASVISACAVVLSYQEHLFSRRVLMMDLLFLVLLMAGSRAAFRIARRLVPIPRSAKGTPVLIYGAGDAGELLLREIFNNPDLGYLPVALVDDDPRKAGKVIHGLRVYSAESLPAVCESLGVQEVLISTSKLLPGRVARVTEQCDAIGLPLRQMRIELARLNAWEHDPLIGEPIVLREPRLHVRPHGSTYVMEASPLLEPKQVRDV